MILISIAGAVLPALLLVRYFIKADRFPEPTEVIKRTFWLGVLTVFPVLLVAGPVTFLEEYLAERSLLAFALVSAFLGAAIPEEFFKFQVLKKISKDQAFDEPMDGIVYGAVASLGFATFENILYCLDGGLETVIMRAITAVPMHASCGAFMGYYFSKAHFKGESVGVFSKAYVIPVLLHGVYNSIIFIISGISEKSEELISENEYAIVGFCGLGFVILCLVMFIRARGIVKEMRREQDALTVDQSTDNTSQ